MVIAADRRQARVVFRYIVGLLEECSMLLGLVERRTAETIDLTTGVTIEVHTASFRSTRGYTIAAAVCDEIAFWRSDQSANPDAEILGALRPGMATIPGSLLLCISSPYSKKGELWRSFQKYYGKEDPAVLVWKGSSQGMNPTLPDRVVRQALERDASAARAEYLAEFRSDLETYISTEQVQRLVVPGRHELPPVEGVCYRAFTDPSGGRGDSFTLAIGHLEGETAVLDQLRERRSPFSPKAVVTDFAETLRRYRLSEVTGDRYSAEWVAAEFGAAGISYRASSKPKSQLYSELLPVLNTGQVELLDNMSLVGQLSGLERRALASGRESIDHPPGSRDDLSNALAGFVYCSQKAARNELIFITPDELVGRDRNRRQENQRDLFQESLDIRGL